MPDPQVRNTSFNADVNVQAFLYANGELNGVEAMCFERRLAEEQAAREALSQAVFLCQRLGASTGGPDPIYRERVRRRLRPQHSADRLVGQRRGERGHSVIWCVLGAAAVLLFFAVERIDERQKVQAQLHDLARELVDLDIQVLDLKTEQLKQELSQVEDELLRTRGPNDKGALQRHQGFIEKANHQKK
jgi:hypothetical protein